MAKSDRFTKQHDELLVLANELAATLDAAQLTENATKARSILNKLAGKLLLHLGAEDQFLYPHLLASGDAETKRIAQQFVDEMGGISQAFVTYNNKWKASANIQADATGFINETKAIYAALAKRIEKENTILYPLMDRNAA